MVIPSKENVQRIIKLNRDLFQISLFAIMAIALCAIASIVYLKHIDNLYPHLQLRQILEKLSLYDLTPIILCLVFVICLIKQLANIETNKVRSIEEAFNVNIRNNKESRLFLSPRFHEIILENYDSLKTFSDHFSSQKIYPRGHNHIETEDGFLYSIAEDGNSVVISNKNTPENSTTITSSYEAFEVLKLIIKSHCKSACATEGGMAQKTVYEITLRIKSSTKRG